MDFNFWNMLQLEHISQYENELDLLFGDVDGQNISSVLQTIRDPSNHDYFQSTPLRQPLNWIIFHMDAPEEFIFKVCQEILLVCPFAAKVRHEHGELPIHYSCRMKYRSITELLLTYYSEGATKKTFEIDCSLLHNDLHFPIMEDIHDLLPIHLLVGVKEHEDFHEPDENIQNLTKHIQILSDAYPEGLLEQTSEGQTALHIAATVGQATTFMELLRLCPKAVTIRDIEGDLPIDLILHPFEIPYDRFGFYLSFIISELIRVDTENSINSILCWLDDHYIIGLCPSLDETIRFSPLGSRYHLPMKEMLSIQEMMSTLIHSVFEYKTTGEVIPYAKRKKCLKITIKLFFIVHWQLKSLVKQFSII